MNSCCLLFQNGNGQTFATPFQVNGNKVDRRSVV
jgi:hypothetical protein